MKVSERLAVIDRLAVELQNRYDFAQASAFLRAFYPEAHTYYSDYDGVKEMATANLINVNESVLGEMIDDLGIESIAHVASIAQPPALWQAQRKFRAFISHLSVDKRNATRLRDALAKFSISAFVAHEDIDPTLEWQVQIERALRDMELFISIHTPHFSESVWAQQEIGFAVARGVKIVALRMGEDPRGFISKYQALSRGSKPAEKIAEEIDSLLLADERTRERYIAANSVDEKEFDIPF